MKRITTPPRPNWQSTVEDQGLSYAVDPDTGREYWDESAYYELTENQVDYLENVTAELHTLCVTAARHVLEHGDLSLFGLPEYARRPMLRTLNDDHPSLYGRFDLAWDGAGDAKMIEYNADTPTSLVEGSVTQWLWLEDLFPNHDQWNSIHERLVEAWRRMTPKLRSNRVHFTYSAGDEAGEDWNTVAYLRDTANAAGLDTHELAIEQLGWHDGLNRFVDDTDQPIDTAFKLYPWENMLTDEFGRNACDYDAGTTWLEPMWKAILSNKALLAILWELNPGHPNLLPAYLDGPRDMAEYAKKSLHGREGDGVTIVSADGEQHKKIQYGDEGYCYQQYAPIPSMTEGRRFLLGTWVVDGHPAGLGIREFAGLITDTDAWFVPHRIAAARPDDQQQAAWIAEDYTTA